MNETAHRPAVQWTCSVHGLVDTWPCPFCPRLSVTTWWSTRLITETELQSRLDTHARAIEERLDQQRDTLLAQSERLSEQHEQIGVILARLADQDAEIARLKRILAVELP